ncbi:MAG: Glucokinase (EC 2.7.1.2) [Olavius algarvensis Delta 4 endosymbiont]|nr:MAG: Glucokinase (EC 2.7.1.2) [Olavius algarvensis Delta 4 endosymbiont]
MPKEPKQVPERDIVILAGDIGGTKTNLGLFQPQDGGLNKIDSATYSSREASGLGEMIAHLLAQQAVSVSAACFGVAGSVVAGAANLPNLDWSVSEASLRRAFGWQHVQLVNDLVATAIAAPRLNPSVLTSLNQGDPKLGGNLAVIAPGTGLGLALMIAERGRYQPVASEGGHADFAPNDEAEADLWRFCHQRFGHVSVERVLSGQGLVNIFEWLRARDTREPIPAVRQAMVTQDPAAVITRYALADDDALCREALQFFCRIFGAVAGNLALTGMATGGVFLGGGIPPKILPALRTAAFMEGFISKGRFSDFMQAIPVQVICEDRAALFGAAQRAYELAAINGDSHDSG